MTLPEVFMKAICFKNRHFVTYLAAVFATMMFSVATHADNPANRVSADAKVLIVEPADGAVVPATFTIKFGASDVDIVPAGVMQENSGHHHLLVDMDELPDLSAPLPTTEQVIHFGKAQTETEITLTPGTHTLQLVLGNFAHAPHTTPVISKKITITVEE